MRTPTRVEQAAGAVLAPRGRQPPRRLGLAPRAERCGRAGAGAAALLRRRAGRGEGGCGRGRAGLGVLEAAAGAVGAAAGDRESAAEVGLGARRAAGGAQLQGAVGKLRRQQRGEVPEAG
jgi:hypothetical protein